MEYVSGAKKEHAAQVSGSSNSSSERASMKMLQPIKNVVRISLFLVANRILVIPMPVFVRMFLYRKLLRLKLGKGSSILCHVLFSKVGNFELGENSVINNGVMIDNRGGVMIGRNVSISYGAMILTGGHSIDSEDFGYCSKPVVIEDHVWICARAIIQPGVTIGRGAVVLTGAVVTKNVPPGQIVGGNPARSVSSRGSSLSYSLNYRPIFPYWF